MQSAAKGSQIYCLLSCDSSRNHLTGRVVLDLMQWIKDDKKPPLNSLAYATKTWLKEDLSKLDMDFHEMFAAHASGDPARRWKIVEYCARDSEAVLWLIDRLTYVPILTEQARVCFTPTNDICNSGQQVKVYNNMASRLREIPGVQEGFCINSCFNPDGSSASGWPSFGERSRDDGERGDPEYIGATVIDPKAGYYGGSYVTTLDFKSLYPSIMMAQNLCYSTIVNSPRELEKLKELANAPEPTCKFIKNVEGLADAKKHYRHVVSKYELIQLLPGTEGFEDQVPEDSEIVVNDKGQRTFKQSYYFHATAEGILPKMLANILEQRQIAKNDMKNAKDPMVRAVQNGRQLALKISANSVYGFTGTTNGKMPIKPLAAIVTLSGRGMIDTTWDAVERMFPEHGAEVVYGDTDSVMVKWKRGTTLEEAWELGERAAAQITKLFLPPNELENECIKANFLLFPQKKTYAALEYEMGKDGKLHSHVCIKGLDPVRRDKTEVLRRTSTRVLTALLEGKGEAEAFEAVTEELSGIAEGSLPYEDFSLTKSTRPQYKTAAVEASMP